MQTTKYTASTHNRPEGERIIDAPFVFADLEKYSGLLKKEDAWKKNDRNSITIFKSEGLTIVLTCLHKDAAITDNSFDGLLIVQVLEGVIDLIVNKKKLVVKKDQLISLHPGILHTISAKEETTLLLINKTEDGIIE